MKETLKTWVDDEKGYECCCSISYFVFQGYKNLSIYLFYHTQNITLN